MKFSRSSTEILSGEDHLLRQFFDSIALRYDLLNQILSFRLDDRWRKRARDLALEGSEESILDLGIGTGKFLELFLKAKEWKRTAGIDFSPNMLDGARRTLPKSTELIRGDFQSLPFQSESFDLVISAFTFRSVRDMHSFLSGVLRVLNPKGKAAFLCLTRPVNPIFRILAYPYLKFYLPWVGGLVSGNRQAYQFLAQSILTFQEPIETAAVMSRIGFSDVKIHRFTLGLATLIVGRKSGL